MPRNSDKSATISRFHENEPEKLKNLKAMIAGNDNSMLIPIASQSELLFFAFRYALGRKTYAADTVAAVITGSWPCITQNERAMYKREIREAQRQGNLGMDGIDAPLWLAILELPN